ncbi:hypothetical protein GCM10009759_57730 [Kitasatospora saccharophila]|uniref:PknH-like protein n=1 Tax=Kitasatospora saccharophila TaxID=407973 RepID=A0ABP5JDX6_9ACTN
MYQQPPGTPPGSVPPPPSFPPPGNYPPPPGYGPPGNYPPPGYGPPGPPRRPRTGLWVAIGLVAVLLVGGGAYALASKDGDGPAAAGQPSGGGTAAAHGAAGGTPGTGSGTGGGSGAGGGSGRTKPPAEQKLWQVQFPSSFLGMEHNEEVMGMLSGTLEAMRAAQPDADVAMEMYSGGQFGERFASVISVTQDQALSDGERAQAIQEAWTPQEGDSGTHTIYNDIQDVDPGPLGGTMQCAESISKRDQPDINGQQYFSGIQCIAIGVNTAIVYDESEVQSGLKISKTAEDLRQFRSQAEVPR